jgi:hypothetical protein
MQERPPYVRFALQTVETRDANGGSITRDVEHVLVTPAGSKDVHVAEAEAWIAQKERLARETPPQFNPQWAQQFRASYQIWKQGVEVPTHGTPIRSWPVASPSEVKRCIDANVLVVEDLAIANENALAQIGMGARAMKDKARAWLAERDGPGANVQRVSALEVENTDLKRQIEDLRETVRSLGAKMADRERKPYTRKQSQPQDDADVIQ